MPGPVPAETKRRRNKPPSPPVVVPPGAFSGATPELPNSAAYSGRTLAWYQTWRESEQAPTFTRTAWLTLWMLADLVEAYFSEPTASAWAQIKQTQSGLLALPADQRRAGFKVDPPKKPEPVAKPGRRTRKSATVTRIDARRARLTADAS